MPTAGSAALSSAMVCMLPVAECEQARGQQRV
jgi:hypothetical protein